MTVALETFDISQADSPKPCRSRKWKVPGFWDHSFYPHWQESKSGF